MGLRMQGYLGPLSLTARTDGDRDRCHHLQRTLWMFGSLARIRYGRMTGVVYRRHDVWTSHHVAIATTCDVAAAD